jgi:peptide methionine sulfoxide reductase MsrB
MEASKRMAVTLFLWLLKLIWRSDFVDCFLPALITETAFPVTCTQGSEEQPTCTGIYVSLIDIDDDHPNFPAVLHSLRLHGFETTYSSGPSPTRPAGVEKRVCQVGYRFHGASGMMQLCSKPPDEVCDLDFPRWIPIVSDVETVLIKNGWSFLDPDESEPISAFDVSLEGTYNPKWGKLGNAQEEDDDEGKVPISSLGYDLVPLTGDEVSALARSLNNYMARSTLLEGATDPPRLKKTCNDFDFSGPAGQSDLQHGVFSCAIGDLPLFSTRDLSPSNGSSGWLSFARPIANDHVLHVDPEPGSLDRRIEVLCARSRCHLGHFFGRGEGYCINASSLNFIPRDPPLP